MCQDYVAPLQRFIQGGCGARGTASLREHTRSIEASLLGRPAERVLILHRFPILA